MIRKISVILAIVLALLAVSPVSFAATPLWKEAGEKIAPMEKEHDYYDTWDPSLKAELVRILYEAEELQDDADAARLVNGEEMTDGEKGALCDRVVLRYLDTTRDDLVSLESLISELRGVYGGTPAWSVEDKYWYNELLRKNGMLSSAEDPDYILPEDGDISQEEAVRIARNLLESKGDWDLDSGVLCPSFELRAPEQRVWTIWYDLKVNGEFDGTLCYVELLSDGSILSYHIPDLFPLNMIGILPDDGAVPEEQALETGKKAMAEKLGVAESGLGTAKAWFTTAGLCASGNLPVSIGRHVWTVTCAENTAFAMLDPDGTVLYTGEYTP